MIDQRLEKIKQISAADLGTQEIFGEIDHLGADYLDGARVGEAKELWFFLDKLIGAARRERKDPTLYRRYDPLLIKLAWIACPIIPDDEVEKLYKSGLLAGISLEIDLIEKAKSYFGVVFGDLLELNRRRKLILNALRANEELLGKDQLKIESLNLSLMPHLKNWLRDYDQNYELMKRQLNVSRLEYLNTGKNVRQLNPDQRNQLRQVFTLYDFIIFLPQTEAVAATGHLIPVSEEPGKKLAIPAGSSPADTAAIIAAYRGSEAQEKEYKAEEEKLKKAVAGDKLKLRNEFFAAVQVKNIAKTVACLRILAEMNDIAAFLKDDQRLNKFITAVWGKKYGAGFVADFNSNPGQPRFARAFIRYILAERLGLNDNDAARIGLQIGNIFVSSGKIEYNNIAYYDMMGKKFVWFED